MGGACVVRKSAAGALVHEERGRVCQRVNLYSLPVNCAHRQSIGRECFEGRAHGRGGWLVLLKRCTGLGLPSGRECKLMMVYLPRRDVDNLPQSPKLPEALDPLAVFRK